MITQTSLQLDFEELEARIAPSALGNPGNNNPGENNTNLQGNQPKDGGGGGGDNSDNNNPGENNTNLQGNQPKD
jgi:hypothetical protein